jgi:hypothetical protein
MTDVQGVWFCIGYAALLAGIIWALGRRKYRPVKQPDGGTLQLLPPEPLSRNWQKWAAGEWARWERGQFGFMGGGCPGCYYQRSIETDHYALSVCPSSAGKRRWKRHIELDMLKAKAAGECRCGGGTGPMVLHPGESWTVKVEFPDA